MVLVQVSSFLTVLYCHGPPEKTRHAVLCRAHWNQRAPFSACGLQRVICAASQWLNQPFLGGAPTKQGLSIRQGQSVLLGGWLKLGLRWLMQDLPWWSHSFSRLCRHSMGKQGRRLDRSTVLAFCTGVLVTWSCTFLVSRIPAVSFMKLVERIEGHKAALDCPKPTQPGIGLTPLALQHITGRSTATSDILIVAARHDQVSKFARAREWRFHCPQGQPLTTAGAPVPMITSSLQTLCSLA